MLAAIWPPCILTHLQVQIKVWLDGKRGQTVWAQHICIKASTYSNLLCTLRSMIIDDFMFCQLVVEVQLKSQRRMKTDQISAFLKSELKVRRNSKMRLGIGFKHRCMLSSKLLRSVFLSFVLSAKMPPGHKHRCRRTDWSTLIWSLPGLAVVRVGLLNKIFEKKRVD